MPGVTLGLFDSRQSAEAAIENLKDAGYDPEEISVIMRDVKEGEVLAEDTGTKVAGGAVSGATTGGVIGGIAGLLVGVGAIAVPGIGGLLIGGPIAAALGLTGAAASTVSGAVTGALAGGLLGALVSLGLPEDTARIYEERIREGAILVAVPTDEGEETEARGLMEEQGSDQTRYVETQKAWI